MLFSNDANTAPLLDQPVLAPGGALSAQQRVYEQCGDSFVRLELDVSACLAELQAAMDEPAVADVSIALVAPGCAAVVARTADAAVVLALVSAGAVVRSSRALEPGWSAEAHRLRLARCGELASFVITQMTLEKLCPRPDGGPGCLRRGTMCFDILDGGAADAVKRAIIMTDLLFGGRDPSLIDRCASMGLAAPDIMVLCDPGLGAASRARQTSRSKLRHLVSCMGGTSMVLDERVLEKLRARGLLTLKTESHGQVEYQAGGNF